MQPDKPKVEKLDSAESFVRVWLETNRPPAFFQIIDVDMSQSKVLIDRLKTPGKRITYTHLLVQAVAISLQELPELHQIVIGNKRYFPDCVNVGLMISGAKDHAPMMMNIKHANKKDLSELAQEIVEAGPKIREEGRRQREFLRRWGWVLPYDFLRKPLFHFLRNGAARYPNDLKCFVISAVSGVEHCATFMFDSTGMITPSDVRDCAVAVGGKVVVRPIWTLTCVVNHRAWDGQMGEKFLVKLKSILENAAFKLPKE